MKKWTSPAILALLAGCNTPSSQVISATPSPTPSSPHLSTGTPQSGAPSQPGSTPSHPVTSAPQPDPKPPLIDRGEYKVDVSHPAIAKNERVRFLVMHYTAIASDEASIRVLSAENAVSAHYLVLSKPSMDENKPVVLQLVDEDKRAWHAGVSDWKDRSNLNDTSIGIEIVSLGYTGDGKDRVWHPYATEQIDLVSRLARDIIRRYDIAPDNIVGHSDIAPGRKVDPGTLFPWQLLAEQGVGAWPDEPTVQKYLAGRHPSAPGSVDVIQKALKKYGYRIPQSGALDRETSAAIGAFQLHFRANDFSGKADAHTEAIAQALVEKYLA